MTTKPKTKTFDCVEFKRQAQARIYEEIKDLSADEQIDYFRHKAATGPLGDWWRKLKDSRSEEEKSGP